MRTDAGALLRLAAIIESSDDAIIGMTLDGIVTSWNPAAETMFGYAAAEAIDRSISAIVPPERLEEERGLLRRLGGGERIDHFETVRVRKDGRLVDVSVTLSPIKDSTGAIIGISKISRDIAPRKRADEQRELWRVTLSSIGDAVITTDREGRVTFMNPVAEALTAWHQDAALGRALPEVFQILNEETRQPAQDPVARVLREGRVLGLANHTLLLGRDGRERPIDDSAAPIQDDGGNVLGVVLVFHDISARRRAEAEMQEQERRFRAMADSAPVMIWMSGTDALRDFFNKPWLEFTGRAMGEELGNGWAEGVYPEDFQRGMDVYLEAFTARRPFRREYRLRRADGEYRWILDTGVPRFTPTGEFAGYIGSCLDITDRRRAEEEMAEQREWLRVTLGSIGDAVITTDTRAHVTFMNPVAEALTGWRHEDAVGRPLEDVFHIVSETTRRRAESPVARVLREGLVVGLANHTVLVRKDGSDIPIDDSGAPIRDRRGNVIGVVLVFHDIVERKRAERERAELLAAERAARGDAERASRTKDEFLAAVSHELRTPLNAIVGWTRMLLSSPLAPDKTTKALQTIERNAHLQVQLIESLLDISRIITGKLHLDARPTHLAAIIEAAIDVVRASADDKGIAIQTSVDPSVGPILGDPDRLQQIVWNLLSNAIRFTPSGGRVRVAVRPSESQVVLSVTDTGQGISPDLMPHIFERFRQGKGPSTAGRGGLGLGLAIVRQLVELHGGSVRAESPGEGLGATFTVSFPIGAPGPRSTEYAERPGRVRLAEAFPSLSGVRVLLVEDDADSRYLLAEVLERCGADVTAVALATEALAAVAETRPDILVSDIGLPDDDGYALLRKIRALPTESAGIPALAVTAFARAEDRRRALEAGFAAHMSKPVDPRDLAVTVANLLEDRDRRRGGE